MIKLTTTPRVKVGLGKQLPERVIPELSVGAKIVSRASILTKQRSIGKVSCFIVHRSLSAITCLCYAPINVMPHPPPLGQDVWEPGALVGLLIQRGSSRVGPIVCRVKVVIAYAQTLSCLMVQITQKWLMILWFWCLLVQNSILCVRSFNGL